MIEILAGVLAGLALEVMCYRLLMRGLPILSGAAYSRFGVVFRLPLLILALWEQEPWWLGFCAASSAYYLWLWWCSDDNDERRRRLRRRVELASLNLRSFLPDPPPSPA